MKMKISPSQAQTVEGEPEEVLDRTQGRSIIARPTPEEISQHFGGADVMDGVRPMDERITALYKAGLFTRAVVTWANAIKERQIDPKFWGIVIAIHPQRGFPLETHWTDGKTTFNSGDDLLIIYRGITSGSCSEWILEKNRSTH
jgi:hypothetical protein